ncbi:DUF3040 domain-containing protein [Schaalia suimastitidis]|uniref:DUF3040 domain-containing protein n=1 Tax=Schaalia suimastitidis TaxID=121163 RepID=UPI000421950B|nr:DUF3040 domain-containing protein [Schaalia suimastitidis]
MALSEYEKLVLQQMEEELRREDPELASQLSRPASRPRRQEGDEMAQVTHGHTWSPRRLALGISCTVAGLIVLVSALSLGHGIWTVVAAVIGFVLMLAGVLVAMSSPKGNASKGQEKKGLPNGWAAFIADQERRWDERRG